MHALVRCGDRLELFPDEISPEDRELGSIIWCTPRADTWQIVKLYSARERAILSAIDRLIGRKELMELLRVELPPRQTATAM